MNPLSKPGKHMARVETSKMHMHDQEQHMGCRLGNIKSAQLPRPHTLAAVLKELCTDCLFKKLKK